MATYSIKEDENFPWVNLITINSNRDIDISNEVFNITVKDQLEYFVADHIKEGSTFELEELFKKDTYPTLEISNNSTVYEQQNCFTCNGTHRVVCSACGVVVHGIFSCVVDSCILTYAHNKNKQATPVFRCLTQTLF